MTMEAIYKKNWTIEIRKRMLNKGKKKTNSYVKVTVSESFLWHIYDSPMKGPFVSIAMPKIVGRSWMKL